MYVMYIRIQIYRICNLHMGEINVPKSKATEKLAAGRDVRCSGCRSGVGGDARRKDLGLGYSTICLPFLFLGVCCDKQQPHDFLPFFGGLPFGWEDSNPNSFTASTWFWDHKTMRGTMPLFGRQRYPMPIIELSDVFPTIRQYHNSHYQVCCANLT